MNKKLALTNWKTTTAGVLGSFVIIGQQLTNLLDADVATNCDWNIVVYAIINGVAFIAARDADKSSEGKKVE